MLLNVIIVLKLLCSMLLVRQCESESSDLTGQPCITNGVPGRCVPWRRCLTLALDRHTYARPGACSYNGTDPIICCTSCHLVDDVSKAVIGRLGGILWKDGSKSWNKCLDYMRSLPYGCADGHVTVEKEWSYNKNCFCIRNRIWSFVLNGREAARAEYPHMALLGFGPDANNGTLWVCSGSVISERYILTAGHCMATGTRIPVSVAALGILKRSDPEELWQKYGIEARLSHPDYHPPSKYHDIALLRTEKDIEFNRNVLPACLPHPHSVSRDEQNTQYFQDLCDDLPFTLTGQEMHSYATAVGWGATGHREALSDTLQSVYLQEYNSSECMSQYGVHRHMVRGYDHTTQMCYGDHEEMHDTCDGDSGGPLQVSGGAIYCQYKVIGVTSFGRPCGLQRQAGVYTRVEYYVPWIESVVWPDN